MMNKIALLYTTVGTQEQAEQLATLVLSKKLAACVNIFSSGKSLYLWQGRIECANECYLLFKTPIERMKELEHFLINAHPYDVPAILSFLPESSQKFIEYLSDTFLDGQRV